MSFFKKLMGGTFESNRDDGQAFFEERRYGEARLAFEKALGKSKDTSPDQISAVKKKVNTCRLELARAQIAAADLEAADGDVETAIALLREAREICRDDEILAIIQERHEQYESEDARRLVGEAEEISEEDLLAVIAGTWTDSQADEYAALPDEFREALLLAHDRDFERARELLEGIVDRADLPVTPCFLWLEIGKVRLGAEDEAGAVEALDKFIDTAPDDEDDLGVVVAAYNLIAIILARLERFDEAKEALVEMTHLAPEDHNVFLALGVYLRDRKEYDGAVNALTRAVELMGQMQPDFRVIRELGFTYLAQGRKQEAMESLGAVIEHLASRGEHSQFDPEAAVALAKLHEETGDTMQAADIYRHLAVGYDTANHFIYNLEAARLLKLAGGDTSLIERYLARASELAENDEHTGMVAKAQSSGIV
ncbi:MAG: tetratricopeptide repeat protein [Deltaproteobacteria bacterium]|nr:tetratricopeptide repeat protein [Deltaproteobacteria bacterium]